MKKLKYIVSVLLIILLINPLTVQAKDNIDIYFFYSTTCPHCSAEKAFLEDLDAAYDDITIYYYTVNDNNENLELMEQMAADMNVDVTGVPFTIIGDQYFIGYTEGYTDEAIRDVIDDTISAEVNYVVDIPLLGTIQTKDLSLPAVTVLLGLIDGFNPCAMWVLLFLLSMLIGMHDHRRVWVFGLTFILASSIMYFLFMAAWLNLTIFLGSVSWIRYLVAAVALIGGGLNLKSGLFAKADGCEVVDDRKRDRILDRIRRFTKEKSYLIALAGVVALAVSVNLIELLCSAGIPVIYAQILAMNEVSELNYYLYLLLYILFFMLDDIIVFVVAVVTMKLTGISTKYGRISHLVGGIVMIIIGILLIFAPGILMFN